MQYGKTEWNRRPAECRAFIERAAGPAEALPKKMVSCMTVGAPRVHTAREHVRRRQPGRKGAAFRSGTPEDRLPDMLRGCNAGVKRLVYAHTRLAQEES